MTATPIPAGVLTVDDDPTGPHFSYPVRLGGLVLGVVSSWQRGRLLAGPARPDGVPDGAVPVTIWFGPENESGSSYFYMPDGSRWDWDVTRDLRDSGVPVPPYQPDPDLEALLNEKITADWAHPDPADRATDHVEHYRTCNCLADSAECCRWSCACHAIPVAGERPDESQVAEPPSERTGPLGLNEQEVRFWAGRDAVYAGPWAEGARALQAVCRAAVAEWDAQPEPAETPDDIAAELRSDARDENYLTPKGMRTLADRIEAASRPDPDTITVNRDDLAEALDWVAWDADPKAQKAARRLRAALAAARLPQEPTEGGES